LLLDVLASDTSNVGRRSPLITPPHRKRAAQPPLNTHPRRAAPISFWGFTKYGVVVATVTVLLCVPYLWLRYFVVA
ncbi:MAG: hypothetical protein WCG47_29840, partial [Dermatophilaceae bacterium]